MELLAIHGQWEAVTKGFRRWGLETHITLTDDRLAPTDYSASWLDELREEIEKGPGPGNVLALAFAGSAEDAGRLHSVLESSDPESKLAHACVVGLEMLEDRSDRGVASSLITFQVSSQHYSATRMLMRCRYAGGVDRHYLMTSKPGLITSLP